MVACCLAIFLSELCAGFATWTSSRLPVWDFGVKTGRCRAMHIMAPRPTATACHLYYTFCFATQEGPPKQAPPTICYLWEHEDIHTSVLLLAHWRRVLAITCVASAKTASAFHSKQFIFAVSKFCNQNFCGDKVNCKQIWFGKPKICSKHIFFAASQWLWFHAAISFSISKYVSLA